MKDLKLKINLTAFDKVSKPFKAIAKNSENLRENFKSTGGELAKLKTAQKDLAQYKGLQGQLEKNSQALAKAQKRAQELGAKLKNTDNQSKKMAKSFEVARNRVTKLKLAQNEHMQKLAGVRNRLKEAQVSTKNLSLSERKLGEAIKKTNARLDDQAKKLNQAKAQAQKFQRVNTAYEKSMATKSNMSFVGFAGVEAGRWATDKVTSLVNPGIQFEESMSKVGALARLDTTSETFQKLQAQAETLGASTSFSATQAAQGMGFLAMAGFKANDILAAMPSTLALAKAGNMDLAQTADIASNILSGFGLEASEMTRVSDVLAAAFTRSNVDLSMLGDSMKYVAPIVKELGGSMEDAAAMSGLLGNVGIQGSQAGTALRAMFTRMAAPPKMARDAIQQLGLATKDAQGNMRPMVDILADVARKTKDMGNSDRMGIFKKIAGEEAGTAFAQLVNEGGAGEITKFVEVLKQSFGEAQAVSKKMGDNTAGDLKQMSSAYEALAISLTQTNTAPMRELIQLGTNILKNVREWVKENPQLAGTLLKVAAVGAGLVTVLGGLALGVAGILGPFAMMKWSILTLGLKAKGLVSILPMIASGFRIVGAAMAANPIGFAIAAIAGAATVLYTCWDPITKWFADFWESLPNMIKGAISWLTKAIGPIGWLADKVAGFFSGEDGETTPAKKIQAKPIKKVAAASVVATTAATQPAIATQPVQSFTAPIQTEQVTQTVEINIHAAPGMDANQVAQAVRRELEQIERERKRRTQTRLFD